DALSDSAQYYVRAQATLGTIAEQESERAGNTVFGDDDSTVSIAGVGKMLFHAVLQVNDYLQSVSSEMRTRTMAGRALKFGVMFHRALGTSKAGPPPGSPRPARILPDLLPAITALSRFFRRNWIRYSPARR